MVRVCEVCKCFGLETWSKNLRFPGSSISERIRLVLLALMVRASLRLARAALILVSTFGSSATTASSIVGAGLIY